MRDADSEVLKKIGSPGWRAFVTRAITDQVVSYTRTAADPTKYLYNAGAEKNDLTGYYETFYRNYDASIGRFTGVDIMAAKYSSMTPYQYAFNDPVTFNDPLGDDPVSGIPQPSWDYAIDFGGAMSFGEFNITGFFASGTPWSINSGSLFSFTGIGSGHHWTDRNRSVASNLVHMNSSTFNGFYKTDQMTGQQKARLAAGFGIAIVSNGQFVSPEMELAWNYSWTDYESRGAFIDGEFAIVSKKSELNWNSLFQKVSQSNGGATVYVETDGVGHVYIEVDGNVYSYGRYNGSDSPSSGPFGPTGDGVLLKYSGSDAQNFIKTRTAKYPTVSRTFDVNVAAAQAYFDNLYLNGTANGTKGVVVDQYYLIGNNCSTTVCAGLRAGGFNMIPIQTPASFAYYINYLNDADKFGPITNDYLKYGPY